MRNTGRKVWALIAFSLLAALACESPTPVAPAESGLSVSANPTRIAVDGVADITVIARQADGSAVNEGTEINFSTNLGSITPRLGTTNDRGIAEARLRGDGRVGTATVEVSSGAASPVMVDVQIGSQPITIVLNSSTDRISKDGGMIDLSAVVSDDLNNAVPDSRVTFSSTAGTLVDENGNPDASAVTTDATGEAKKGLRLTANQAAAVPDGLFEVTAETVGAGEVGVISDTIEIEVGGFVQDILVNPVPSTIPITGGEITVFATVFDDIGDTVEGVGVNFGSDIGTPQSAGRQQFTDADGVATDVVVVTALDIEAVPNLTSFQVTATAPGLGGFVEGSATVAVATSVGSLFLEVIPGTIDCETPGSVELRTTVLDETNNPNEGVNVNFSFNSTLMPGVISPVAVLTGTDGIARSFLTVDADDLPCTDMGGTVTVINEFTVRSDAFLQGEQIISTATIRVNFPTP